MNITRTQTTGFIPHLIWGWAHVPKGLLFAITTSGSNVVSARAGSTGDYCCQILDGEEVNDSLFVLIYELDDENEVDDPAMWIS